MNKRGANEDLSSESKGRLWKRLQAIHAADVEAVQKERKDLEEEKKSMAKFKTNASDILSLNVGGELVIQAHRETLCIATGSTFSCMFTGRWEESCVRDEQGRIFLDHDPEMIRWIINFLRLKKIENPLRPVYPPLIPKQKKKAFMCLLNYFGMTKFFYPHSVVSPKDLHTHRRNPSALNDRREEERLVL